ncbi:MAG TPA: phosphatidylinositol kinase [Candidatus Angelobacter sp.]|jgi:hypothetical protein|nr:phosphatidylinositol kinase [Candidatus Angelobacter sp.]
MPRPDDPDSSDRRARDLRRGHPHRPHLDPPLAGRIMRVERLRGDAAGLDARAAPAAPHDGIPDGFAPDDGGLAADTAVLFELATAPVRRMARIVYSSNAAFVLELDATDPVDASRPLRAVYKPVRGERPLWDFPHRTLHFREVATYLVAAALSLDVIPATTLRDGPLGPGSVQLFVDALDRELTGAEDEALEPLLRDIAALDVLVNNADRKQAHLLVTPDARLRGIDHGLTFLPYPRQRTVLIELGGTALPAGTAASVAGLAGDPAQLSALRSRLSRLLAAPEVDAFAGRLTELAADPTYPVLDPWDGRPFEWW